MIAIIERVKGLFHTIFIIIFSVTIVLILITQHSPAKAQNSNTVNMPLIAAPDREWETVGGNPQRTSWIDVSVAADLHVEWFRPIDAYIPPNFQVITANNLVYISSARGLYALRFDTGDLVWRYDSELPLGNAPTIATINGTSLAFVGGYDKKIHAFNALTGQKIWEFIGAKAGFDANPLVIGNMVYVGSRDGHFYAINAVNGKLVWQFPSANEEGLGAIHLSPAYNNGLIYFATDYNYAYALTINGSLRWKSQKMVGDGYNSYWPVVYKEPSNEKVYVIFSGKKPYREFMRPGTRSVGNSETYTMYGAGLRSTYRFTSINDEWAKGKTVLDYTPSLQYFEQHPYHRTYTILDGSNGEEYSMDFDLDGKSEYFPVWPVFNPSTENPPVIGPDGLIYINNLYQESRSRVMGWKFGTPYFALTDINDAADEPMILSGSGDKLYRALCCSRTAGYVTLPGLSRYRVLWPYGGNTLGEIAPGYDQKIFYLDPSNTMLDNLTAQFGNVNGIYGYHGDQNPMVPYKGKLYTIKGNSVIAFGTGTLKGNRGLLTSAAPAQTVAVPSTAELKSLLENEIQKIVSARILKPGYTDDSMFGTRNYLMGNYFDNPGDALYTLSIAYPHLSDTMKSNVKSYLRDIYYPKYFDPVMHSRIGWKDGEQRDSIAMPPEVIGDFENLPDSYKFYQDETLSWYYQFSFYTNPNNFYAMWKYAAIVAPEDTQRIYQQAKNIMTTGRCQNLACLRVPPIATAARFAEKPYELNAYIAGYHGFLELQKLANQQNVDSILRDGATQELNRLRQLRVSIFSKDTPYTTVQFGYGRNFLNISRNFIFLTPETANDLQRSRLADVQRAYNEYNTVGSYWFVSRFNAANAESGFQNLYDSPAIFSVKAWVFDEPRSELYKYLDAPAFERGDMFYIQNLIMVIEAPYH